MSDFARIRELYEKISASPLGMSDPWSRKASNGKPLLYGGRRGLLANGTIATWDEFDLIVEVVNALPQLLAAASPPKVSDGREQGRKDAGRALIGVADWLLRDPESDAIDGHVSAVLRELGDKLLNMTFDDLIIEGLTGMADDLRKVVPLHSQGAKDHD